MSEYSRFFGGPEGSVPEYTQPQFAEVLEKIFSDGVFTSIGDDLAVVENDPVSLSVVVGLGEAWIQGFWYQNTADLTKTLAAADPDNDRIDRIVLRLDTITNFKISVEVLTGTPAGSPAAPALTQTASTYEISLAQVSVLANATSVNNAKITDERTYVVEQNFKALGGWIPAGQSWSYASASTITVPSGAASIYQIGDKIKITQTTDKFFYISAVADTVLTVNGAGLYTVANTAITLPCYSRTHQPFGFPIKMIPGYVKCRVALSAEQSNIAADTATKVLLDSEIFDTGGDFASYKFVAPVTAKYLIHGVVTWVSGSVIADKLFVTMLYVDGAAQAAQNSKHSRTTNTLSVEVSDLINLAKDSYVELYAYHFAGANTPDIAPSTTYMSIHMISVL